MTKVTLRCLAAILAAIATAAVLLVLGWLLASWTRQPLVLVVALLLVAWALPRVLRGIGDEWTWERRARWWWWR
jgi:hypothetical protein